MQPSAVIILQFLFCISATTAKYFYKNDTEEFLNTRDKRATVPRLIHKFRNGKMFNLHEPHDYTQIYAFLSQLEHENPDYVKMVTIGKSSEKRNIMALKISSDLSNFGRKKDVFWIDGGIHAREWNTPMTALILVTQILKRMKTEPEYITSRIDWLVIPVLNPDGYIYSHGDNGDSRMWRKSRSNCPCRGTSAWGTNCRDTRCCGVDLNRNFDTAPVVSHARSYYGSMMAPAQCEQFYAGVSNGRKEPETLGFMRSLNGIKRLRAYLSLHDSGQYWIYPYARTTNTYPKNIKDLRMLSNRILSQIRRDSGRVYKAGTAPELLYEARGTSGDWAADRGVEFVFTAELPPVMPKGINLDTAAGQATWRGVKKYLPQAGQDMWTAVQHIAYQMVSVRRKVRKM